MGVCGGDLYGGFSPVGFLGRKGEKDCVGVFLRENTLGSWLFILQADLDCKCNPNNSSNAQQHRECLKDCSTVISKKVKH